MSKGRVHPKGQANPGRMMTPEELDEVDPDKPLLVPNRRNKRSLKQRSPKTNKVGGSVAQVLMAGVFRKSQGSKTGQPEWFRRMKYEAETKRQLMKVRLDSLEPAVGTIAVDLYKAGYKTVWDVAQVTDVMEFQKHGTAADPAHGIRIKDLKKLHAYLTRSNVPLKWSV